MFGNAIEIFAFIGVAMFMVSVSNSLQQIAKDLQILSGRPDPKPPADDPEHLIDA